MTTHSKCKICGHPHSLREPHIWGASSPGQPPPKVAATPKVTPAAKTAPVDDDKDALIAELRARVAELEADAALTAARREKNREAMAARRAAKKGTTQP